MTRDETIDLILARSARPGNTNHLADLVKEWNLAQQYTFERGYPKAWFLLDIATITVDGTGYKAPLPADFIELYEEEPAALLVASDGSGLLPLERAGRPAVEWGLESPNTETAYEIMEGYLLLATQQTAGATIRILYYAAEPVNSSAYGAGGQPAANRWLTYMPDLLIGEVGRIYCGTYLRDDKGLAFHTSLYVQARQRLIAENTGRKEAARQRFLNGNLYPVPGPARTVTATP